jgi:hypothetical protein
MVQWKDFEALDKLAPRDSTQHTTTMPGLLSLPPELIHEIIQLVSHVL